MSGLTEIREGIAANLSTLTGCQVSAYMETAPTLPCIHVFPDSADGVDYHQAMRNGQVTWVLAVQGITTGADRGAQQQMDKWLAPSGAGSVFAALESDPTLGGAAMDVTVTGNSGYQPYTNPSTGSTVVACTWRVEVLADGR